MHDSTHRGLYVPLDVNMDDDPAIIEAGADGELVYTRSLRLAKRIDSGGVIHRAHLNRLAGDLASVAVTGEMTPAQIASVLVRVGLWIEHPDGWVIVGWLRWNPSAEEMDAIRSGNARGAHSTNHQRWHEARDIVDPACTLCQAIARRSTDSDRVAPPIATESLLSLREEEVIEKKNGGSDKPAPAAPPRGPPKNRGSRIPQPFDVSDDMIEWAKKNTPGVDWQRETVKFVNYWISKPGQGGVKLDWTATWRSWQLKAAEYEGARR